MKLTTFVVFLIFNVSICHAEVPTGHNGRGINVSITLDFNEIPKSKPQSCMIAGIMNLNLDGRPTSWYDVQHTIDGIEKPFNLLIPYLPTDDSINRVKEIIKQKIKHRFLVIINIGWCSFMRRRIYQLRDGDFYGISEIVLTPNGALEMTNPIIQVNYKAEIKLQQGIVILK